LEIKEVLDVINLIMYIQARRFVTAENKYVYNALGQKSLSDLQMMQKSLKTK